MGRIRCIKPEFAQSETLGRVSRDARLLFVSLWTIVDDSGRTRAASRLLASLLYPYDDDAPKHIDGWLAELEDAGTIRRYLVDGNTYLDIPNWLKHQKIDRPSPSKHPPFGEGSSLPREDSSLDRKGSGSGKGRDRKGTDVIAADAAFVGFWSRYPRKVSKPQAEKAWRSLNPTAEIVEKIHSALDWQIEQPKWREERGRYVPHAATWLNNRRWEDEPFNPPDTTDAAFDRVFAAMGVHDDGQ
jgi:hypothetical protein